MCINQLSSQCIVVSTFMYVIDTITLTTKLPVHALAVMYKRFVSKSKLNGETSNIGSVCTCAIFG